MPSSAVTVNENGVPAAAVFGAPLITSWVLATELTMMPVCVPVIVVSDLSVALMLWVPAVSNVASNVATPLSVCWNVYSPVSRLWASLEENWTVPT